MKTLMLVVAFALPLGLAACSDGKVDEAKLEGASNDIEQAGKDIGRAGEDVARAGGQALEDTGDKLEDVAKDLGKAADNGVEKAEREIRN